jgi:hypothetical protein
MAKSKNSVRKRRLKTLNDCVRAGAWLFNATARDEIELDKSGKLTYLLNVQKGILQAIESLEIEKQQLNEFNERLRKIEEKLGIAHK